MKRAFLPSLLAGAALALTLRRLARPASAGTVTSSGPYDAVDAYVERERHRLNIPGVSLAIVEGDRIVHLRGFGRARPGGEAPTPQTPFFIGSLTKSFTALAAMQLVEARRIDLDAPVQRYLPWFRVADPQASARMTVRHLLNQTSGLPAACGEAPLADFDDSPGASERQARALATVVLARPAGAAFEYCNANYSLLGLIIEAASGQSYADYVQKHIFTPLDMRHTYTSPVLARENGVAVGHQYWFTIPVAAPNMPIPHGSLAAGLLISSSEDIAHYLIAHLDGGRYGNLQVLSSVGIDELHRGVGDVQAMGLSFGQYGMGWFVDRIGQTKAVWHTGTLPDFSSYAALLPEQKKGIVLLFNGDHHWMVPVLGEFGAGAAALLAGEQPAPIKFVGMIPWAQRGMLLVPALQLVDVVATVRRLRCWRHDPGSRPSGRRKWGLHVLLPLIPNLLVALALIPMLGKRRDYLKLYMPDFSWIAMVCGGFSLVWSFVRTGLVLRILRK